ncbi:MAG: AMP-binding protein [Candidatus Omnitrophica bacterium]|jgi:acyl-CoA synthetase (AMP-forming)/AMP-acid ligase II|nr:AMP-binding protein [Candidatus Omnitrophota bacterium]
MAIDFLQTMEKHFIHYADKTALIFRDQAISFGQLKDRSLRLANSLAGLGIKKGDKVAVYLPNWPEYIYSYLAIWTLGATCVPLDFMLTVDELISCIAHSEAKVLIMKHKANLPLEQLRNGAVALKNIITCHEKIEGAINFEELLEKSHAEISPIVINEKDYAIIFYTSGTTGKPKGVLINYLQLGAPPKSMGFFVNSDMAEKDTALCALPFSHLGGLIYIQNLVSFGYTLVLMERFIPVEFLKNISVHKVNFFWIVPSMYYALLQLKEFESFDLSSLRWIVTFGASNSPDALRRFRQYCPKVHLLNGWGLTETNAPTTVLPMGSGNIESVGRAAPWIEVKIYDENGKEVANGAVGEVVVKSWVVTDGYYNNPELTREVLRNGWFHTGDLGKFDKEGQLYIVGRIKEMIKVGGEIVFEPEVESALHKNPDIAEAAVIGVQDKLRGEVPKAFIVLKEGKSLQEEDLRYFLRQHLAHFKIPHYFEFKDALPKNRTGKIDKEQLRLVK